MSHFIFELAKLIIAPIQHSSATKEIGKRIHICANTLQDIVVKMD
jgi:hypothetical protein